MNNHEITQFSVGVYINDIMSQLSIDIEQLSVKSRLSIQTIQSILDGERDMTERISKRMGIALGLPKDYLYKVQQSKSTEVTME